MSLITRGLGISGTGSGISGECYIEYCLTLGIGYIHGSQTQILTEYHIVFGEGYISSYINVEIPAEFDDYTRGGEIWEDGFKSPETWFSGGFTNVFSEGIYLETLSPKTLNDGFVNTTNTIDIPQQAVSFGEGYVRGDNIEPDTFSFDDQMRGGSSWDAGVQTDEEWFDN